MKAILLANVGNRDVKYHNEDIKPPRLYGKEYLERFDMVYVHLTFPIIEKGLKCIFAELNEIPLDQLILFYTDQNPDEVDEKHYQSDTLYFAEIIERLIHLQLSDKIRGVTKIKIPRNPNDYDYTYDFFSRELEKIESELKPDRVFLSPAGGIPACNMNLILQGSRIFTRRAVTLLIPENPEKPAKLQKLGDMINRENKRQILHRLLDEYNFGGVAETLEGETDATAKSLLALARMMQYRLFFDFKKALDYANQIKPKLISDHSSDGNTFDTWLKSQQELLRMLSKELHCNSFKIPEERKTDRFNLNRKILAEILANAFIKWYSHQYVDFIGRIFRLQEGLLRLFYEERTGNISNIGDDKTLKKTLKNAYIEWLNSEGKGFAEYAERKFSKENETMGKYLSQKVLMLFLEYCCQQEPELNEQLDIIYKIEHLSHLRNKSIIAHGNKPVTKEIINQICGEKNKILKTLHKIEHVWGIEDCFPDYQRVKDIILKNF